MRTARVFVGITLFSLLAVAGFQNCAPYQRAEKGLASPAASGSNSPQASEIKSAESSATATANHARLVYEPLRADYEDSCFTEPVAKKIAIGTFVYKRVQNAKHKREISLRAYVYYPPGVTPDGGAKNLPAIAVFHGGGFMGGTPLLWHAMALRLASEGIVVASFQYRNFNSFGDTIESLQNTVADSLSAMRWLRKYSANLAIDPTKLAVAGDSAGGTLATLTGLLSQTADDSVDDIQFSARPNFIVAINPVLDLSALAPGGGNQKIDLSVISPLHLISKTRLTPGILILQGDSDTVSLPANAPKFCDQENSLAGNFICLSRISRDRDHNFFADPKLVDGISGWDETMSPMLQFISWGKFLSAPRAGQPNNPRCVFTHELYAEVNKSYGYGENDAAADIGVWD